MYSTITDVQWKIFLGDKEKCYRFQLYLHKWRKAISSSQDNSPTGVASQTQSNYCQTCNSTFATFNNGSMYAIPIILSDSKISSASEKPLISSSYTRSSSKVSAAARMWALQPGCEPFPWKTWLIWHENYTIALVSMAHGKLYVVMLSILLSMYVACPLAAFGSSLHPW